ncbi:MAG: hypothetical protein ACFFD4_39925 [Candidatus Odinarchaeota archaeon]
MSGDVVQIDRISGGRIGGGSVRVSVPSWSGDRGRPQCSFQVLLETLRKLKHRLIAQGTKVVVTTEMKHRGRDLRGRSGTVILPTDSEGDVGVEFAEGILGGGSLDGRGEDGKCLYVPVGDLEEVKG